MAREEKSDDLRPRPLGFRVSELEYEAVNRLAEARAMSVADLLRERVNLPGVLTEVERLRKAVGSAG